MRYSKQLCVRSQVALDLLGKRWMGVILLALLESPMRFNDLAGHIETISDRMLAERLRELEQEGIVERRPLAEGAGRVDYALTDKGRALAPVFEAIREWSHAWIPLPESDG